LSDEEFAEIHRFRQTTAIPHSESLAPQNI
jgi:hypothetical protein